MIALLKIVQTLGGNGVSVMSTLWLLSAKIYLVVSYRCSCSFVSVLTNHISWTAGTETTMSSTTLAPPKKTGNACASQVTGLNMIGKVKFSSPRSTYGK